MNIFISAGHENNSDGTNYNRSFFEHTEAVIWRDLICDLLGSIAVPVGKLRDKISYINDRADSNSIAIEIHFNSAKNSNGEYIGRGCETLHYPMSVEGIALATKIHRELLKSFSPDRGIKPGYYQMNPNKPVNYFLAKTKCPSIIIEPEFIHKVNNIINNRRDCCRNIARSLLCG